MLDFISSLGFSLTEWISLMGSAALIGVNKAGIIGISLPAIPLLAAIFGGKTSTGVIATFLVMADSIAVANYRKSVRFDKFLGLLPWTLGGMALALLTGSRVSDHIFKILIAGAIIVVIGFMILKEVKGQNYVIKSRWYINAVIGLLGGFTTLIGNVAGPIMATYFLSIQLNKDEFIATRAWFFWMINALKIPLHLWVWKTINVDTFRMDLLMLPVIGIGALIGILVVKLIPERPYRIFIMITTVISAIFIII